MAIKISVSEAIKRIGSKRDYYRYVEAGLLPICRETGHHAFHLEDHFYQLELNLDRAFNKPKSAPRFLSGRRLTAREKIMLA